MSSLPSSFETILASIFTLVVTAGCTWIFFPAWVAWKADGLEWEESLLSSNNNNDNNKSESILLSLVIPAYNEQDRIPIMLQAAHDYLKTPKGQAVLQKLQKCANMAGYYPPSNNKNNNGSIMEWLVVNDGSTDDTCRVVQSTHESLNSKNQSSNDNNNKHTWKLVSLKTNSGKGAAVKTGMLLANGYFRLMVDADGATDFGPGLERLTEQFLSTAAEQRETPKMVAIFGSRAHLEQESATQRSFVRTILMHAFHFFVSLLVSSRIHDTQCGFKLFTQDAAIATFTSLHLQRWAFDTEVILLCDQQNIEIVEVPVPWHEVDGSKLNTSKFALAIVSITMLRDMICVRLCHSLGIWKVAKK